MMIRPALIFTIVLFSLYARAQDSLSTDVWVKVLIKDNVNNMPIENAQIISYETMQVFATDSSGTFRNIFSNTDSLKIFGLGYDAIVVKVNKFEELDEGMEINLTRRTYMIRSVNVAAEKKLHLHLPGDVKLAEKNKDETPMALRSDVSSGKPPIIAAVFSPISYAYYYTSKKERRKRNAIKELRKANEQSKVNEFFNRKVIKEVSGYQEGDSLTNFIIYCNINLKVTSRDNPLLVKQQILELKKKFELDED